MYADLCKRLNDQWPKADSGQSTIYRRALLSCCQTEFENGVVAAASTTGDSLEDEASEAADAAQEKQRRRMLGNIRFIGELFKKELIAESIIQRCADHLLVRWRAPCRAVAIYCHRAPAPEMALAPT